MSDPTPTPSNQADTPTNVVGEKGFLWNEENYLPKRHKCNERCDIARLKHFVKRPELSPYLNKGNSK